MGIAVEIGLGTEGGSPDYSLQGFGKDVTGAGPSPTYTYTVTTSNETGEGSWESIVNNPATRPVHDCLIQFAVSTVNVYYGRRLGSNVTIDGFANGQNGVTFIQDMTNYKYVGWEDPASNILIRGIRFQGDETAPDTESDLVTFDGTNEVGSIVGIAVDRCTFIGAGDGALDLTGSVTDVTVQRCLFYATGKTSLCKYLTRARFTYWGNVYGELGYERMPQIKGDIDPFEFVNNIVYRDSAAWVGMDIRGAGPTSDSPGLPTGNVRGNYFYGTDGITLDNSDSGYEPDVYINGNTFGGGCADPGSPRGSQVSITEGYQITPLAYAQLESLVLDLCGAPNKTARDLEVIAAVRALL